MKSKWHPGKPVLAGLALLACAALLLAAGSSATSIEIAQLLENARAETEARIIRAPDGTPLCFPAAALVEGTEAHLIDGYRGVNKGDAVKLGDHWVLVDVFVEETDAPALLMLRSHNHVVWRLNVADAARLAAVHLMGHKENFVIGVPEGVPVTSRFRTPLPGGKREYCVFAEPGPGGIVYLPPKLMVDESQRFSKRYSTNWFALGSFGGPHATADMLRSNRRRLGEYAGIPLVASRVRATIRAEVSRRAVALYEAVRQRGRAWLAAHPVPPVAVLGPGAETVSFPEGIVGIAAMEWLAERGYAVRTGRDTVEYLCGRRLALALRAGEDLTWDWDIQNCRERSHASRMFTILGPIRVTGENCGGGERVFLLVPPDIQIDWDRACGWRQIEYPRAD